MDKQFKAYKWGLRFYAAISLRRVVEVRGVNSRIDEKTHFLMWDFDGVKPLDVFMSLRHIQRLLSLPNIIIMKTKEQGYHAYCFKACSWEQARSYIALTPFVDKHYLAIGIGRGYFTLRFSAVPGRKIEYVMTLESARKPDIDYKDVTSFVEYTKAVEKSA